MKNDSATMDRKVVVTRVIRAPLKLVYRAWSEPDQLAQWFSPSEVECRDVTADVRVGGAYRVHMASPKGDHIATGVYTEVVPNQRLQFTWQWEAYAMPDSRVTVDFEDLGDATRLTLTHEGFPDQEDADEHSTGWNSLVSKFAPLAEQGRLGADESRFVLDRTFQAPAAEVWRALTDPSAMKQWYFDVGAFKPEPGFEFQFTVRCEGSTYVHHCRVTEAAAPRKLAYTWRYAGYEGESLVTFELFEEGAVTRLRLTHSGLESFPKLPSFARENFAGGWLHIIKTALADFLASPRNPATPSLVEPYLTFGGRCEEALAFYRAALGAQVEFVMLYKDSPEPLPSGTLPAGFEGKVMHAAFRIGATRMMASDGCAAGPDFRGFSLSLSLPGPGDAEHVFRALADGGHITMPLAKTFWSPCFGMVQDRFGVAWMVTVRA